MRNKKDFGAVFWLHFVLMAAGYLSFLLIDWWLVLLGVFFLKLHYALNGNCFLTNAEFGKDRDTTFVWYYLKRFFPDFDKKKVKFVVRTVVPVVLVALAVILQVFLGYKPLWS